MKRFSTKSCQWPSVPVTLCLISTFAILADAQTQTTSEESQINRNLLEAVTAGSIEDATRALDAGADVNSPNNRTFGLLPLVAAVQHHDERMVNLLLAHGARMPFRGKNLAYRQKQRVTLEVARSAETQF